MWRLKVIFEIGDSSLMALLSQKDKFESLIFYIVVSC